MNKPTHETIEPKVQIAPLFAGYAAVFIVSILILIKTYAYYQSGSLGILSSLTDSIMDSLVSIMALASIYYAKRPADADHRWGHGKMEAVSALFQSAVIAGGGVFIIFESLNALFHPAVITHHETGIYVMGVSIVLSLILVMIQRRALSQTRSLALEADNVHYASDVLINAGTIIVLILSVYNAPLWLDPAFAIMVALFMGYIARGIAMKSLDMLLDHELPEKDRSQIIAVIQAHEGVLGWHDLRTHRSGENVVMSFDIEVARDLSLWDAHEIAKALEEGIIALYPNADIIIHIDPQGFTEDARHRVKGVHI